MDNNVLCFCKLVVTDDCHVTYKKIIPIEPTMNGLSTEQVGRTATRFNDAIRTDQSSRELWREVQVNVGVASGSATAKETMPFREYTFTKCCFEPNRRWMKLGIGVIVP